MGKVLIVDDSEIVRQLIKTELEKHAVSTCLACNGKEAFEILLREEISLIFLDIHMPKLDGIEFLDKIKEAGIKVPCVVVSNELDIDYTVECKKLGAKGWLSKPIKKETLIKVYNKLAIEDQESSLF